MSDELRTLLGEWKALEAAATPGPWEDDGGEIGQHWSLPEPWQKVVSTDVACMDYCYGGSAAGAERVADAAFIAASRTVVPRLIAAVEAVLEEHPATRLGCITHYARTDCGCEQRFTCATCAVTHPCPTVTAIRSALIGGGDE